MPTNEDSENSKYPPLTTPQALAEEYGVPLSQRLKPDFSKAVPKRLVSKEEAEARGLSWFYPALACRYSHQAARRTSNEGICSDCERIKDGLEPIYGKSRAQVFYKEPRRKPKTDGAPVVIQAPAAPAPLELPKRDTDFLAALAEIGSFDAACEQKKVSRGQIEGRASSSAPFATALNDVCQRLQIPRTLKAAATFAWTKEAERNLVRHFINSGLMHSAREAVGLTADEYFSHLESSPDFRSMIEEARPLAMEQLKERSLHAASVGNEKLLTYLTKNTEVDDLSSMSPDQMNAELAKILKDLDKRGVLCGYGPQTFEHRVTRQRINLNDYRVALDSNNFALEPVDSNADLVGAA